MINGGKKMGKKILIAMDRNEEREVEGRGSLRAFLLAAVLFPAAYGLSALAVCYPHVMIGVGAWVAAVAVCLGILSGGKRRVAR